jgi:flagellar basal body rod protein FlgG
MIDAIDIAQTGLAAMTATATAAAGNIANLDTDGYQSRRVDLSTAGDGAGVQVAGVTVDTSPGALRPDIATTAADTANISDQGRAMVETSNVDLVREMVTLNTASRGFEANAAVILAQEDMAGTILDMRV